jgi:hypothetical protein
MSRVAAISTCGSGRQQSDKVMHRVWDRIDVLKAADAAEC